MKMEIYTADDDPWMRSFHFIFIRVRRVLRACGWVMVDRREWNARWWSCGEDAREAERGGDGMGWRRRSLARARIERLTREK